MKDIKIQAQNGPAYLSKSPVNTSDITQLIAEVETIGSASVDTIKKMVSLIDLTSLEATDTRESISRLCQKAVSPRPSLGSVAAVCVYPNFVNFASQSLAHTSVQVASVATGFPSGQTPLEIKKQEVIFALEQGATEIDMVILRGEFLSENYQKVFDEIFEIKMLCGKKAHLKVILETGELSSLENTRLASELAILAGADFIKTSTGKISQAAAPDHSTVMLQTISLYHQKTQQKIGFKPAGGIRTTQQAYQYFMLVKKTLGEEWLTKKLFRFGASSLLQNLISDLESF